MTVTLRNVLTNERWVLPQPPGNVTFASYSPGDYSLLNEGGSSVTVVLWGTTYTVPANTNWRFMSHSDLENIAVKVPTQPPGKPGKPRYAVESTYMKVWPPESDTYSQQPEILKALEAAGDAEKPKVEEPKVEEPKEPSPDTRPISERAADDGVVTPAEAGTILREARAERERHDTARAATDTPKEEPKSEPKEEHPKPPRRSR